MYGETYWCSLNTKDNWNKSVSSFTLNNNDVTKTIFDPNPASFLMPKVACFTGFLTSNGAVNASGTFNRGYYLYTYPNGSGGTIFISAKGLRSRLNGNLESEYEAIEAWTSGAANEYGKAYYLELGISYANETGKVWYTGNAFNIIADKK